MTRILTDTHTHSIFSCHAYSTLWENTKAAAAAGMEALAVTDHFSPLQWPVQGFENYNFFMNRKAFPTEWEGVRLYLGAEADIVDTQGNLFGYDKFVGKDSNRRTWLEVIEGQCDYMIGSVHAMDFLEEASVSQVTDMYCRALENKKILTLGHIGRSRHKFDLDTVLLAAKENNKFIELNNTYICRPEYRESFAKRFLERAAELGVSISVSTDSHCAYFVGKFEEAEKLLDEVHFPEELIGTRTGALLEKAIERLNNL